MNHATIIHNPGSGDERYSKNDLEKMIESAGLKCRYLSTKEEGWKNIPEKTDVIIVAGGDGTVKKVSKILLERQLLDKTLPIALLPLGTANNIAKTLNVPAEPEKLINVLKHAARKDFDVGRIENIDSAPFFLESLGFGIFPYLMQQMEKKYDGDNGGDAAAEIQFALQMLHDTVTTYEAKECKLTVDGTDHSGRFILAEIMNIRSIGPNLVLAPLADPGDGEFEVVLVPESQKTKFAAFIKEMMEGSKATYTFHTLKGSKINIQWSGSQVHVDDKIVKVEKGTDITVEVKRSLLQFLSL